MAVDNVFATTHATRDAMIRRAAKLAGVLDGASSTPPDIQADGVGLIPDLIGMWHNEGINLNTDHESIFPMPAYSTVYNADETESYVCILNHTAATDNRPETGANWRTYWRLGGDIYTGSAIATWATGTAYLAPNQFAMPAGLMYVKYAFARDSEETTQFDIPVSIVGEVEFQSIANKFTTGRPVSLWMRERPWESKSAFCWPGVPDSTSVLHVIGTYLMSDMVGATSDLDAPQTARLAFIYDLASLMADLYQRPTLAQVLVARATALRRNFFRVYQESKSTVSQVAPRFARRRGRRL